MEMASELLELNSSGFYYAPTASDDQECGEYNVEVDTTMQKAENLGTVDALEDEEVCWICLAPSSPEGELFKPCSCPRMVHQSCLAQWQIMQCGRSEESNCRFCQSALPKWEAALEDKPKAAPLMTVSHNGQVHILEVAPGEEGRIVFEHRIREIFGLNKEENVSVTFGIKEPFTGSDLTLDGWSAWSAAVVCASCSAGSRPTLPPRKRERANGEPPISGSAAERSSSVGPQQAESNCLSSWWAFSRWRRTV